MYLCPVANNKHNDNDKTCKQHIPYYPPRTYCVRGGLSYAGDADSKTDDNGNNKALPHQKAKRFDGEGLI
ncbi:MAG: hypothetical protein J6T96_12610 [Bacteroidales bacterium]|nr:hypothetical protein [Bacteroidales bacterium]